MTPRQFLGERLAMAREAAGYKSQVVFADKLGWDRSTVNKIEAGKNVPSPDVLKAWADVTGIDLEMFEGLCELARSFNGVVPAWVEAWLRAEREASILRYWQPLIMPGIAQTRGYAHAVLLSGGHDADTADELVNLRMARRDIFDVDEPPDTTIVVDEFVLRRVIGSREIMREQLAFILELAERPYIVVQVVTTHTHAGLSGSVHVATIDGKPDVATWETSEGLTSDNPGLVRRASVQFSRCLGDAGNAALSRETIMKAMEQL
jgi:transcriptional regulator with XRE-family HTH domain